MKIADQRAACIDRISHMTSVQLTWLIRAIEVIQSLKRNTAHDTDISRWVAFTTVLGAEDCHIGTICDFAKRGEMLSQKSLSEPHSRQQT